MHGHSPAFTVLVNAEVDSMGGVVDGGTSIGTKTSPRQQAIEKVQTELRQEYDIREERKRELEFLEQGGNPLDFKFSSPASLSVQSTSLADQLHESEQKGSVALAGDSSESSRQIGSHFRREPNIADNLFLLDGETSAFSGGRNGVRAAKRRKDTVVEQYKKAEECSSVKDPDDSSVLRLGARSQAYARRKRDPQIRDGHQGSSVDDDNRSLITPASQPHAKTMKVTSSETLVDDHAIHKLDSKQASSSENNVSNAFVSENVLEAVPSEMHIDVEERPKGGVKVTTSENGLDSKDQHSEVRADEIPMQTCPLASSIDKKEGVAPISTQLHETLQDATAGNTREVSASNNLDQEIKISQNDDDVSGKHRDLVVASVGSKSLEGELSVEKADKVVNGPGDQLSREDNHFNNGNIKEEVIHDTICNLVPMDSNGSGGLTDLHKHPAANKEVTTVKEVGNGALAQVKNEELHFQDPKRFEENPVSSVVTTSNGLAASDSFNKVPSQQDMVTDRSVLSTDMSLNAPVSKVNSETISELQSNPGDDSSLKKRAHEDSILNEARIIEAKLKKALESPVRNFLLEKHRKSHWDYVLEEMAWLANDFMQERLWKITAASQLCHRIAFNVQLKFEEILRQKQRSVAREVAKAVVNFWQSVENFKTLERDELPKHLQRPIQCYAVRFLQSDSSLVQNGVAEAPPTPERLCDEGSLEVSREELHLEVPLFYGIPLGSMGIYRQSVEMRLLQNERMRTSMNQVDYDAPMGDSVADFKSYDNVMEEDEGETMYGMSGFEGIRPSKSHKKRKSVQQKNAASRLYEAGFDLPGVPSLEHKFGSQPSSLLVKRPPPVSNVGSIPTKRVRSAARRISPFVTNAAGAMTSKTDVSSGDTSSFQDDESSLHISQKKNSEFESTVDFEKHPNFDGSEAFTRPKKKKAKYFGYRNPLNSTTDCGDFTNPGKSPSYDRKWPTESLSHLHQKDLFKGRFENNQLEYNGSSGPYSHPAAKKLKITKHLPDTSPEAGVPNSGPIPSPVASQMSNMSNSTKLKLISSRDRVKKNKALKVASALSGPGGSWSLFEDQALVVLVHDMGPNWELVSDAINSTLQFKYIFRTPKECKERHKILIDKTSGDGADSAEDSGCSTPYPSTLPGIPKGSARQLFQRLQGPMEEETLKSHFEKIIMIGQRLHSHRNQKGIQDLKQITPPHNSHALAVSQACPNNMAGGSLTPLDLCDTTATSDVLSLGYQGHNRIPNHLGPVAPILPASTASTMVQGSPSMAYGNGFPSPSAALNTPAREMPRYAVPRPASLSVEDQQKLQYRHMLSGRASPGHLPIDRSARMLSPGSQIGMIGTMNHGMPMPRPGFQTIGSPSMLNMVSSASMLSPTGVGITNPVSIHSAAVSGQGGPMMRSREALQQMLRNSEDHRQMIIQDMQMQGTQGNGPTVAPFNSITTPLSNQTIPPVQTYSVPQQNPMAQGPQQPHTLANPNLAHIQGNSHSNSQQQAFALRLAKDRQIQQRLFHQQPPFSGSTAMPSLPNNPQLQHPAQSSSPPIPPISPSQPNVKQQTLPRNSQAAGSAANPTMKQRPRQQQQSRQQSQQQQPDPGKNIKGASRGNVLIAQNAAMDAVHMNGSPVSSGNQVAEKHMIPQNHALGAGSSCSNSTTQASSQQQKMYPRVPQSSKQMLMMPNQSVGCHQGQVQAHSHTVPATQQATVASSLSMPSQPHQQRHGNQPNQAMHRVMLHQNPQMIADGSMQPTADCLPVNQMSKAIPQGHDPMSIIPDASTVSLSSSQSSFDSNPPSSTVHMANSPQTNLVGGMESLVPSSSQGLSQKPYSGSFSPHGIVGSRKQQQQHQMQKLQQQPQHQLHRQTGDGAYGRPTNSGTG